MLLTYYFLKNFLFIFFFKLILLQSLIRKSLKFYQQQEYSINIIIFNYKNKKKLNKNKDNQKFNSKIVFIKNQLLLSFMLSFFKFNYYNL